MSYLHKAVAQNCRDHQAKNGPIDVKTFDMIYDITKRAMIQELVEAEAKP